MEVHHHSQSQRKKNCKAYFREFLMLSLAVFCGFLAENFREHQREKQFMTTLLDDVNSNTA